MQLGRLGVWAPMDVLSAVEGAAFAQCVWDGQRLELDYARADTIVTRTLDPLGLVLKAGVWYLVAASDGQIRTYRVSRARGVEPLPEHATRPAGFDLAAYWSDSITAYERDQPRIEVTLRVRRTSTRWLEDVIDGPVLAMAIEEPDPEPDSWRRIRVTLDWPREVAGRLLALGGAVEVLEPPELRAEIASLAAETVARSREPASAGVPVTVVPAR